MWTKNKYGQDFKDPTYKHENKNKFRREHIWRDQQNIKSHKFYHIIQEYYRTAIFQNKANSNLQCTFQNYFSNVDPYIDIKTKSKE